MREYITYRLTGTGVWGYEFFDMDRNQIGFVRNALSRAEPVRIEGLGCSWYSRFGLDNTVVPGTGCRVKDNRTGEEVYRIVYWQPGLYQVRPVIGNSAQVEIREGDYLFGPPDSPATALTQRITEAEWMPPSAYDVEPYFRTRFFEDVSREYLMMALSFPALRMY